MIALDLDYSGMQKTPLRPMMRAAHEVLDAVCREYGITQSLLLSKDRHRTVAEARHMAFWLLRIGRRFSYPEIGIVMRRDHTTALVGIRRFERRMERDRDLRATAERLAAEHGYYRPESLVEGFESGRHSE